MTPLRSSTYLHRAPRGEAADQAPAVLQAQRLQGQPDIAAQAQGDVEFRRAGVVIKADRLSYDVPKDHALAQGKVRIERDGAVYSGPEVSLAVQRFEGWFLQPSFEFPQLGAGGRADRVDFLGAGRSVAQNARYTSCPRDGADDPAWVLQADRVQIDLERNEGIAQGAVLRFLNTPILALPTLSFPLGDTRKSGWLPPSMYIDNRSGIEFGAPYYWDIAPNRDATLSPRIISKRGFALDAEFRYLEPAFAGELRTDLLPDDRLEHRARGWLQWQHEGRLPLGITATVDASRVSDDNWWSDFPRRHVGLTPRLLSQRMALERPFEAPFGLSGASGRAYLRLAQWQVLQATDSVMVAPYERSPQLGFAMQGAQGSWRYELETEYNRFTLPGDALAQDGRAPGDRVHLLGRLSHRWRQPGAWVVPQLSINAAAYNMRDLRLDKLTDAARVIPTFSIDAGLELERTTQAFGRALRQTLEPRLLYVNTPYRRQDNLPNFDAAAKDFNFVSIYSENSFSGVDRVSDSHQLTAGFTTRLVDESTGAEALRLGLVQRYLFRPQQVAPKSDGSPDGDPLSQRFSDVLLLGSSNLLTSWTLDAALQYSPDNQRPIRSILGMRYSPGPFRTVSATYRFARGLSEQVELGWQWPILARSMAERGVTGNGCKGQWYSVGRINYSQKDSRITDSVLGLEYDAGCWIGRIVAERLSTGRSAATTQLLLQLELVGLSRIGTNPLRVLKDNIPGYQLLRDERRGTAGAEAGAAGPD